MWRLIGLVVLLAGCAITEDPAFGPPPQFGAVRPTRTPADGADGPRQAGWHQDPFIPSEPNQLAAARPSQRLSDWFRSGRGWTWGSASHGPTRDLGMDRLMVDTLTSGDPNYSRDPSPNHGAHGEDSWAYPSTVSPPNREQPPRRTVSAQAGRSFVPVPDMAGESGERRPDSSDPNDCPSSGRSSDRSATDPEDPRSSNSEGWQSSASHGVR